MKTFQTRSDPHRHFSIPSELPLLADKRVGRPPAGLRLLDVERLALLTKVDPVAVNYYSILIGGSNTELYYAGSSQHLWRQRDGAFSAWQSNPTWIA